MAEIDLLRRMVLVHSGLGLKAIAAEAGDRVAREVNHDPTMIDARPGKVSRRTVAVIADRIED